MSIDELFTILKGSPKSGNYGHSGRPGKEGGSGPGKGSGGAPSVVTEKKPEPEVKKPEVKEKPAKIGADELNAHYDLDKNCAKISDGCEAITDYTTEMFEDVNGFLRGKVKIKEGGERAKAVEKTIKGLEEAFAKLPTIPQDMTITRAFFPDVAKKMKVGTVFTDKGYVSTSISKSIRKNQAFVGIFGDSWAIEIKAPKGAKGIYIEKKSAWEKEQELLLPKGSQFRITGKDEKTRTIYGEYIG